MWQCHERLIGFLANNHLPRCHGSLVCRIRRVVVMWKPWAVHIFPGIYLKVEESSGKPQVGDRMKTMRPVINK